MVNISNRCKIRSMLPRERLRTVMNKVLSRVLWLLSVSTLSPAFASERLKIEKPWVRETLPSMTMTAGYMEIMNNTLDDKTVLSASSNCAKRVEIHEHKFVDGLMKMQRVESLLIKKKSVVKLTPGGYHLMMFDVTKQVKQGKTCRIRLDLKDGTSLTVNAPVNSLVQ